MDANDDTGRRGSPGGPLLMAGLIGAVVAVVVWANLWKRDMRVHDITVAGNSIITEKEILSLASIGSDQRLYSVDLQAAQRQVMQNAFIKSATVNREAPNRIAITVQERVPITAVVLEKMEYIDADGIVLPPLRSENLFDLPVLTGEFRSNEFVYGKQVKREDVKEALQILVTAQQVSDDLYRRISEIHIEQSREIVLYTAEYGVPVVIGSGDVGVKLVKFDGFWREIVSHHGAHELSYIDLRFEDQVVVRWNHDAAEIQTTKAATGKSVKTKKS